MDLKLYYQKIRDTQLKIPEAFPVVVSLETQDGGREGSFAEVARSVAAKLMTEGTVRLATAAETLEYRTSQSEAKRILDEAAEASRVHLTVVSTNELSRLTRSKKEQA